MDHGMASPPLDVHRREATPMVSPRPEGSHAPWRPAAAKCVDAWPGRRRATTPQRRAFDSPRARATQAPAGPNTYANGQVRLVRLRSTLLVSGGTASGGDGDETPCFRPEPGRGPLGFPLHPAAVLGVRRGDVDARTRNSGFWAGVFACPLGKGGGRTRTRTWDPLIKSQLLYQLSYAPEPVNSMPPGWQGGRHITPALRFVNPRDRPGNAAEIRYFRDRP